MGGGNGAHVEVAVCIQWPVVSPKLIVAISAHGSHRVIQSMLKVHVGVCVAAASVAVLQTFSLPQCLAVMGVAVPCKFDSIGQKTTWQPVAFVGTALHLQSRTVP